MSIEIISVENYREFQTGNNAPIRDEDIESAINLSFIQLNGICNNQIKIRWEIEDTSSPLYLDDLKKELIRDAMKLQTKYNLDYDNDMSEGTMQSNWGSNNSSITRPRRDRITQDVLNLLTDAGVYLQFTTQVMKGVNKVPCVKGSQWYGPYDSYITSDEANNRYVPKTPNFTPTETRILCYTTDKTFTTFGISDLASVISGKYATKDYVAEQLKNYITYEYLQANYYTASECDDKFCLESFAVELDNRVKAIEKDYATGTRVSTLETQVSKKVEITSEENKVYGTNGNGERYLFPINLDAVSFSVAYRDTNGCVRTLTPRSDTDAINLKYFNEHLPSSSVYYIELSGTSGTLTTEQRTTLLSGNPTNNYILYSGNILRCVYYEDKDTAVYTATFESGYINYISIDTTDFTWTFGSIKIALYDNVVRNTGDQTITGIKNFATNLQVGGKNVATEDQVSARELLSNKTTTISESSTDTQYPSAKAVYTYIQSLNANDTKY